MQSHFISRVVEISNSFHARLEMQQKIRENGFRELKDDELENAVKFLHDCGESRCFRYPLDYSIVLIRLNSS